MALIKKMVLEVVLHSNPKLHFFSVSMVYILCNSR